MEFTLYFQNYALVKNQEYNLHDGTIFILQGPNEKGKTTFLHALKSLMLVNDSKDDPCTHGEKEGNIHGQLPGADGQLYTFRYEFTAEGKKKFTFIRPDGTQVKNVTEMRAIFNYTHFTVSDLWDMGKTAEGRKKMRELFVSLLSEDEKKRLAEIDGEINGRTGTKFVKRTQVNSSVEALEVQVATNKHNEADQKIVDAGSTIKDTLDKLEKEYATAMAIVNNAGPNMTIIENNNKQVELLKTTYDEYVTTSDQDILDWEEEVRKLNEKITNKKAEQLTKKTAYEEAVAELEGETEALAESIDVETITKAKALLEGDPIVDEEGNDLSEELLAKRNPGLKERVEKGRKVLIRYDQLKIVEEGWKKIAKQLEDKRKESTDLTEDIEKLREEKKKLIADSKNLPSGWVIEDDHVTYEGIKFAEQEISLSKAVRASLNLMAAINKGPVMLGGDAECLGWKILNEIHTMAQEQGKLVIFAEHSRDVDDVQLVCYDEMDVPLAKETPEVNNNSQLF